MLVRDEEAAEAGGGVRIAITGATGSLGGALVEALSARTDAERVVGLSRDEVKSGDLEERWSERLPQLRCQLGDVRDEPRLEEVFRGCDVVVHAAALKRVGHSVYSPEEIVKTNVQGTINVIRAATEAGVGRVLVVSSDKAVEPTNLYGMSKAVAECYAVQSNSYGVPRGVRVSCVRYGNVLGSRGSVVHVWREAARRRQPLLVTDERMTRFIITLRQAADFVLRAIGWMRGGEVFVPLLPATRVTDLADAIEAHEGVSVGRRIVGLRPGGEKLHEALLSREEPARAWLLPEGRYPECPVVEVLPSHHSWRAAFPPVGGEATVSAALTSPYTSDAPRRRLSTSELATMLRDVR